MREYIVKVITNEVTKPHMRGKQMATFTSNTSGNWNVAATWGKE